MNPLVELVRTAIGCGVMMAIEDRAALVLKLSQAGPNSSLADALTEDAEGFIKTRADLVEALENRA